MPDAQPEVSVTFGLFDLIAFRDYIDRDYNHPVFQPVMVQIESAIRRKIAEEHKRKQGAG